MRWLLRIVVLILVLVVAVPFLIPFPPVGVEAETLADADGFFLEIDGLQTYVQARGPEDGVPVILLHGWGASTFSWRENLDAIAEAGYRAIAYDRPPYGLAQKTGDIPYSLSGQADFLASFMTKLGLESAVLVGNSAGGALAGYFAVRYPDRVRALVFVDGVPRAPEQPAQPARGSASSRVSGAMGLPPIVTSLLDFPPFERWARLAIRLFITPEFAARILVTAYHDPAFLTPAVAEGYQRQLRVVGWDEALLAQLKGGAGGFEVLTTEEIESISVPIMIVWGEQDTWVPIEAADQMRALHPNAVWRAYPNVGHLPMEENASTFNADLIAFLAQVFGEEGV